MFYIDLAIELLRSLRYAHASYKRMLSVQDEDKKAMITRMLQTESGVSKLQAMLIMPWRLEMSFKHGKHYRQEGALESYLGTRMAVFMYGEKLRKDREKTSVHN